MISLTRIAAFLVLAFGLVFPSSATLIGTSVTGSLVFQGNPLNYFDPRNGGVPSTGYENSSGTTVTISQSAIEFGIVYPANTDTADFTATQLLLTDVVHVEEGNIPFTATFIDTAFLGMGVTKVSDSFINGGIAASLTGDTLSLTWDGGAAPPGTMQAVFTFISAPEPSSWLLVGLGCVALILNWRLGRKLIVAQSLHRLNARGRPRR